MDRAMNFASPAGCWLTHRLLVLLYLASPATQFVEGPFETVIDTLGCGDDVKRRWDRPTFLEVRYPQLTAGKLPLNVCLFLFEREKKREKEKNELTGTVCPRQVHNGYVCTNNRAVVMSQFVCVVSTCVRARA